MMTKQHTALAAALALAACTWQSATAQDLKAEITVDRTVVPVQRAATRPAGLMPAVSEPHVDKRELSLTEYGTASSYTPSFSSLEPAAYTALTPASPFRGYASLGYFPAFNLGASAGYRFISDKTTSLGAWIQYDGSSYNTPGVRKADGSRGTVRDNTVTTAADFSCRFGSAGLLKVKADYTHAALMMPLLSGQEGDQHINRGGAAASWHGRAGRFEYLVSADFHHFGLANDISIGQGRASTIPMPPATGIIPPSQSRTASLEGAAENRFRATLAAIGHFRPGQRSAGTYGLELSADIINRPRGSELSAAGPVAIARHNSGIYRIEPFISYRDSSTTDRVGIRVDLSTGTSGKMLHIAPDVMLSWTPSGCFAAYLKVDGGEKFNTLAEMYEYSPFAPGAFVYSNTFVSWRPMLGVNVGPVHGLSAEIYAGYSSASDVPMPVIASAPSATFSTFHATDLGGFTGGLRLGYALRSLLSIHAGAEIYSHSYDKGNPEALDRALYAVKATVKLRPIEKLTAELSFEHRGGRRYYRADLATGSVSPVKMAAINDLRFGAAYAINQRISVFARIENILDRRWAILPLIESPGIHGLIGASCKF